MKRICPNCEKESDVLEIKTKESIAVRNEKVEVDVEFFRCKECGIEFENTRDYDALEMAYKIYRCRHNMLEPEQIKEWRKRYGLTQKELSQILGWGSVTLNRYENGALQSEAHEKFLRLAMEPQNLIKLIEDCGDALSKEKRERILNELETEEEEANSFEMIFEERFGRYSPNEYSGYKNLNISKLFNAIIFFCKEGALKTKLNKLLFYVDFKHFKENTVSITGARYVHLNYGPVPDNYEFFTAELVRGKELDINEVFMGAVSGYVYQSIVEPDLSVFTDSELKVLVDVKERFKSFTSTQIKDFSHEEKAYKETSNGDVISYLYAKDLKI
jgi:putative zinc finger/helix-turn-helix YgiT family protein